MSKTNNTNNFLEILEREMGKFQKSQESIGTNMAVVMFMVDALQSFEGKIKKNKSKKLLLK